MELQDCAALYSVQTSSKVDKNLINIKSVPRIRGTIFCFITIKNEKLMEKWLYNTIFFQDSIQNLCREANDKGILIKNEMSMKKIIAQR